MDDTAELDITPLHSLHLSLGARMVPFAGYDMPVQYPAGVLKEHLQTRTSAGLFDVSHMGQVILKAKSGNNADAALALESWCRSTFSASRKVVSVTVSSPMKTAAFWTT